MVGPTKLKPSALRAFERRRDTSVSAGISRRVCALVWIGRGDYDPAEWPDVVRAARERETTAGNDTADYLLGIPNLADLLDEGLAALGRSCAE